MLKKTKTKVMLIWLKLKTDANPSISQCAHVTSFEFFLFFVSFFYFQASDLVSCKQRVRTFFSFFFFLFFHIRGANRQSIQEAFSSTLCLVNLTYCAFWYNNMIFLPVNRKNKKLVIGLSLTINLLNYNFFLKR